MKISVALLFFLFFGLATPILDTQTSPCDLNSDGAINIVDYQLVVNMAFNKIPCTANINGTGICNIVTAQRIVKAAFGRGCSASSIPHAVTLNWTASTSPNIAGYNIYRGAASGGPYTKINTSLVPGTTYEDTNVVAGQTYYYVGTAVNTSNAESVYSNQARATIPSP